MTCIPCPKIDKIPYFNIPLHLNVRLFSKTLYLTAHIKINYEIGCIRTIATAKMELFVALVRSFQLLTNFIKNFNIGAMGVPNTSLEHCNVF